jgi:hypothetical protein
MLERAQRAWPSRLDGYPEHEGLIGWFEALNTTESIDPDVSKAIMKYGFAGGGQSEGFGDAQSYAAAGAAAVRTRAPRAAADSRAPALAEKNRVIASHLEALARARCPAKAHW